MFNFANSNSIQNCRLKKHRKVLFSLVICKIILWLYVMVLMGLFYKHCVKFVHVFYRYWGFDICLWFIQIIIRYLMNVDFIFKFLLILILCFYKLNIFLLVYSIPYFTRIVFNGKFRYIYCLEFFIRINCIYNETHI